MKLVARKISLSTVREARATFGPALAGTQLLSVRAVLCSLTLAALELARPWPLQMLFDRVLVPQGEPGIAGLSETASIVAVALLTLALSALVGMLSVVFLVTVAQIGRKATVRIRRTVFDHLHRLALPFHDTSSTGDLLVRIMGDVNLV